MWLAKSGDDGGGWAAYKISFEESSFEESQP
jgi:hypothetical protein